jgi:hypothetical protein
MSFFDREQVTSDIIQFSKLVINVTSQNDMHHVDTVIVPIDCAVIMVALIIQLLRLISFCAR